MIVQSMSKVMSLTMKILKQISIETIKTPNPNFIKFIPVGYRVLGDEGTLDIPSSNYSDVSPLAQELFSISGVTRVFYGPDYLSIAKKEQMDWDSLKPQIYRIISDYFQNKREVLTKDAVIDDNTLDPSDSEVVQFIKEIIASRIRPNLQDDGGDIKFLSFNEQSGILRIKMVGACAGCPSSTETLKGGIQKMLTYYVPEIKEVISEQECSH